MPSSMSPRPRSDTRDRAFGHCGMALFAATFALVGIVAGCGDSTDDHGHAGDAAVDALDASDAADEASLADAATSGADADADADAAPVCTPTCGAGFVCCTDAHGHNPQCTAGTSCP